MFSQVAERPMGEEFARPASPVYPRPASPEYPRPSHLLWHQQRQQHQAQGKQSKLGLNHRAMCSKDAANY